MFCTSVHKCDSVCGVLMPAHWMAVAHTHGSFQRHWEIQNSNFHQIKSIKCHTQIWSQHSYNADKHKSCQRFTVYNAFWRFTVGNIRNWLYASLHQQSEASSWLCQYAKKTENINLLSIPWKIRKVKTKTQSKCGVKVSVFLSMISRWREHAKQLACGAGEHL